MQGGLTVTVAVLCAICILPLPGAQGYSSSSDIDWGCWFFGGFPGLDKCDDSSVWSSYNSWSSSFEGQEPNTKPNEAIYLGCFGDGRDRALPDGSLITGNMTPQMCFQFCWENNMRYAGLEYGSQCYCGTEDTNYGVYGANHESECRTTCRGDYGEYCGGSWTIQVYDLRNASTAQENDLRMVNWAKSGSPYSRNWYKGTVEIFKDSDWQAICDTDWGKKEASVVCRQLGYGNALDAYIDRDESYWSSDWDSFPGDEIPLAYNQVTCNGDEVSLAACRMMKSKVVKCDSSMNVGVHCEGPGSIGDAQISLEGGDDEFSGVVVIKYHDTEGYVCADEDWDFADAAVICHKLRFGAPVDVLSDMEYGNKFNDDRPFLLGNIQCSANDKLRSHSLDECHHGQWNNTECQPGYEAVVKCSQPGISDIRLADGPTPHEGRLEILHDGLWGTVCDRYWNIEDADVACRMLGYPWATTTTPATYTFFDSLLDMLQEDEQQAHWYGPGDGPIHFSMLDCEGYETTLEDCLIDPLSAWQDCDHNNDVGIHCANKTDTQVFGVRLVDGNHPSEGRVEIQWHDTWGTVCDDNWDINDANVVCRQLGMGDAVKATPGSSFGTGDKHTEILLDEVDCTGNEYYLSDCPSLGWNTHDCRHHEDAGVVCKGGFDVGNIFDHIFGNGKPGSWGGDLGIQPWRPGHTRPTRPPSVTGETNRPSKTKPPKRLSVRLVGGSKSSEGRVEVSYKGSWSSVCNEDWDMNDANVVCTMLGYDGAAEDGSYSDFGPGSGDILFSGLDCNGRERTLTQCDRADENSCTHDQDAAVVCIDNDDRDSSLAVRLVDGNSKSEGHVEVLRNGQWGAICDSGWSISDAEVVCRQLGFTGTWKATDGSAFGSNDGPVIASNVYCTGDEMDLNQCRINWDIGDDCGAPDHAGVVCEDVTDRHDGGTGVSAGMASGLTIVAIVVLLIVIAVLATVIFMRRKKKKPADTTPVIPPSHLSDTPVSFTNTIMDYSQAIGGAIGGAPPVYTPTDINVLPTKAPLDNGGVSVDTPVANGGVTGGQANGVTVPPPQAAGQ